MAAGRVRDVGKIKLVRRVMHVSKLLLRLKIAHATGIRPARRAFSPRGIDHGESNGVRWRIIPRGKFGDDLRGANLRRAALVALRKQCPPETSRPSGRWYKTLNSLLFRPVVTVSLSPPFLVRWP